jgi:hypothetical protein
MVIPVISVAVIAPAAPRVKVRKGLAKKAGKIADMIKSFFSLAFILMQSKNEKKIPKINGYQYRTKIIFLSIYI